MATNLHDDKPTLEDALERVHLVKELGNVICECAHPQIFGVHGDWGFGKTSFLKQLQYYLHGDPTGCSDKATTLDKRTTSNVVPIWFETWRYQNEPMPIIALLHDIRRQLDNRAKLINTAGKAVSVAVEAGLNIFGAMTKTVQLASSIREVGERYERDRYETALTCEQIRNQFEYAIGQVLGCISGNAINSYDRLVIIIDDIDRCDPETAWRLLEGIKIYLDLDNCVFVIGMNQRVLEMALAKRWAEAHKFLIVEDDGANKRIVAQAHSYAREYLEKICQNLWHLPTLKDPHIFLSGLLWDDLKKYDRTLPEDDAFREAIPGNPRQIKALSNLFQRVLGRRKEATNMHAAMIMCSLHYFHQPIYRLVLAHKDFYQQVLYQWAKGITPDYVRYLPDYPIEKMNDRVFDDTAPTSPLSNSNFQDPALGSLLRCESLIVENKDLEHRVLLQHTPEALP